MGTAAEQLHVDVNMSLNPWEAWQKLSVKQKKIDVEPMNPVPPISDDFVRFVCISDTHNKIEYKVDSIPEGDVLLHAGDFTMNGLPRQIELFNEFLGKLPHKVKVVIAGNHDMTLDENSVENRRLLLRQCFMIPQSRFEDYLAEKGLKSCRQLLTNCVYLHDSSVEICGIKVYGAPWVPEFCDMGFNVERGQPLLDKWNLIPSDTDIIMTHGPPLGYGDLCWDGKRAGCLELLNTIQKRVKPKYSVFGHIHEDPGITSDGYTTFINASSCNLQYRADNPPVVFDLPLPPDHTKEELGLGCVSVQCSDREDQDL